MLDEVGNDLQAIFTMIMIAHVTRRSVIGNATAAVSCRRFMHVESISSR
jgi:hypothetical protein